MRQMNSSSRANQASLRGLTSAPTWVVVADVSRRKSCPTARRLSNNGLRSGWRESLKFARTDVRGYVVVVADVSRRKSWSYKTVHWQALEQGSTLQLPRIVVADVSRRTSSLPPRGPRCPPPASLRGLTSAAT